VLAPEPSNPSKGTWNGKRREKKNITIEGEDQQKFLLTQGFLDLNRTVSEAAIKGDGA